MRIRRRYTIVIDIVDVAGEKKNENPAHSLNDTKVTLEIQFQSQSVRARANDDKRSTA